MNYRLRAFKSTDGSIRHVVEWYDVKGVIKLSHVFDKAKTPVDTAITESYEKLLAANQARSQVVALAFRNSRKRLGINEEGSQ